MYMFVQLYVNHRLLEAGAVAPGCVSSFKASVNCLIAVVTSSKPKELAAYLACFCASAITVKEG